ncbi:MAG: hypothetical protein G01um101416_338 [Microgenomates group bacterium Gr01-1014_16]|nr:MAG: hypothetical protein G01um101416_338 [Microgenomates group bacterium Gr01-1014_16]
MIDLADINIKFGIANSLLLIVLLLVYIAFFKKGTNDQLKKSGLTKRKSRK